MKTKFHLIVLITLVLFGCAQEPEVPPTQLPTDTIILPSITPEQIITPPQLTYVALGDSIPDGWGIGGSWEDRVNYVEYFAEYLQEDLNAAVTVQNMSDSTGIRTPHLLEKLQNNDVIRQAVTDADIITIWIGVNDLFTPENLYMNGMCGGEDNLDCIRKRVGEINGNIDMILDEILALNLSEETRIMIADNAIPAVFVADWKNHGCFDVLQEEIYGSLHDHLYQAAFERGIIVVPTYNAINGPLGDKGHDELYIDDGIHFNAEGQKLIADIHREAWK